MRPSRRRGQERQARAFAVVADEVKNLAKQAADATERINQQIGDTQTASDEVVVALEHIRDKVETVQTYVSGTASAVEEQTAVTQEISSNMQQASSAVSEISQAISGISEASGRANRAVEATREAAAALAK